MSRRFLRSSLVLVLLMQAAVAQWQPDQTRHSALQQAANSQLARRHRLTAIRILGAVHGRQEVAYSDEARAAVAAVGVEQLPELVSAERRQEATEMLRQLQQAADARVSSYARLLSRSASTELPAVTATDRIDDEAYRAGISERVESFRARLASLPDEERRRFVELNVALAEELVLFVRYARAELEVLVVSLPDASAPLDDVSVTALQQAASRIAWGVSMQQQQLSDLEMIRHEAVVSNPSRYAPSWAEVAVELQIAILANRLLRTAEPETADSPAASQPATMRQGRRGQPYAATSVPSAGGRASSFSAGNRYGELAVGVRLMGVASLREFDSERDRGRRVERGALRESTSAAARRARSGPAAGAAAASGAQTRYVTPQR